MLKAKVYKIEDSNIANLGSDLEKKVKQAAAEKEPAWDNAGKDVGLLIWRIEKFKVVPWPKDKNGQFYSGDSYIVLDTYKKQGSDALAWDLHFWLGKHTTQDEAGTAANKTVELDDKIGTYGGHAIQHRETQGHESDRFLSYFNNHITLLEGGVDSGFRHVEPEKYQPRLLHFKGKKKIRTTQVDLKRDSLNSSDVFILDLGLKIIQFNGSKSNGMERSKASQMCVALGQERNGMAKHSVYDEGQKDIPDDFWKPLGGAGAIRESDPEPPKDEPPHIDHKTLWRLDDTSGTLKYTKIATGKEVKKSMLNPKDVLILDTTAEVFVWVGHQSPVSERRKSLQYAQQFVIDNKKSPEIHVARVLEKGEGDHFLHHFH
jgi:gelsolin